MKSYFLFSAGGHLYFHFLGFWMCRIFGYIPCTELETKRIQASSWTSHARDIYWEYTSFVPPASGDLFAACFGSEDVLWWGERSFANRSTSTYLSRLVRVLKVLVEHLPFLGLFFVMFRSLLPAIWLFLYVFLLFLWSSSHFCAQDLFPSPLLTSGHFCTRKV